MEWLGETKKSYITTIVWMETSEINVIRKGVDKLIYVFNEYSKLSNDLTIKIIGSTGNGTEYLKKLIKEFNLEDKVIFTGRISEESKIQYLKESKFYFQLSLYEGFGIAALEALAAGNIVFHSGKGGLSEAIGENGILVSDINNYKNIAIDLNYININYDNYSELLKNGIKHVENNFSYKVRLNGIEEIVKKL